MNPENPTPTLADDRSVSPVARRIGPPLAGAALVLTAAMLAWLALAPTAIAGDLAEAPFTVPATLVVGPDDDGCLQLVDGTGATTSHCLDELATGDEEWFYTEAWFDDDGDVIVHRDSETGMTLLTIDPVSGAVLSRETRDRPTDEEMETREAVEEPIEFPAPGVPDPEQPQVYTDGDLVRRMGDDGPRPDSGDDPVVLDLEAPLGYRLRDAVLSPDGAWVVVTTPGDDVVVAPTDGSAAPYVWAEVPDDRWVNLWGAIRWDG